MAELSALPALAIKTVDPISALSSAQDYQTAQQNYETQKAILPGKIQATNDQNALAHTEYGNSMLAEAATNALTADPDQAPEQWDQAMEQLSAKGVPGASQYIGRYTPDKARQVQSAFSGKTPGAGASGENAKVDQQFQMQMSQMQPDQVTKALGMANQAISSWNKIAANHNATPDDLRAEIKELSDAGLPVAQAIPGLDLTSNDPAVFRQNYAQIASVVNGLVAKRDALQERATQNALGLGAVPNLMKVGDAYYDINNKTWIKPPAADHWVESDPSKDGQPPHLINEATGKTMPLTPETQGLVDQTANNPSTAQTSLATNLIHSESGGNPNAQNPNKGQTSGGIGGMTDATYITQAKKLLPALQSVPDAQIIAMKKSGALNGLNTDLVINQNRDDAQILQKNGLPLSNASVAVAYKLGAPDAMKVMKADQNTPLDKILSADVMNNNPQLKGQTAGSYLTGMAKKFGVDPFNLPTTQASSTQYGKFGNPQIVEYTDDKGETKQVQAQQNEVTHKWFTADGTNTPITFPNNDMRIIPAATGGGRYAGQVTRSLVAAKDAAADLGNMVQLPISANSGFFGMRGSHGDGSLTGSAWSVLGNKLTTQEQQDMNTTMVGMGRALAGLETGGLQVQQALMNQYEKLAVQPGDTYATAMRKLATMRQNAVNGAEANMASQFVSTEQKKQFQNTIDIIKKAVPWTPADVTAYQRAAEKNPQLTFADYAAKNGIGGIQHPGAGKTTPHIGDVQKGYRYKGGDVSNSASWEKVSG